jgi:hypothetical protein
LREVKEEASLINFPRQGIGGTKALRQDLLGRRKSYEDHIRTLASTSREMVNHRRVKEERHVLRGVQLLC